MISAGCLFCRNTRMAVGSPAFFVAAFLVASLQVGVVGGKRITTSVQLGACMKSTMMTGYFLTPNEKIRLAAFVEDAVPKMKVEDVWAEVDGVRQDPLDPTFSNVDDKDFTVHFEVDVKADTKSMRIHYKHESLKTKTNEKGEKMTELFIRAKEVWYEIRNLAFPPTSWKGESLRVVSVLNYVSSDHNAECEWQRWNPASEAWEKDDKATDCATFKVKSTQAQQIEFRHMVKSVCSTNPISFTSNNVSIILQEPPTLKIVSPLQVELEGDKGVDLVCEGTGFPEPTLLWVKATNKGLELVTRGNTKLTFHTKEAAKYKCEALQPIFGQQELYIAPEIVTVTSK